MISQHGHVHHHASPQEPKALPWPQSLVSPARQDLGRLTGECPLHPARRVPLNISWIFPDTCLYMSRLMCLQAGFPLPKSPSMLLLQGTHRLPPLGGPLPLGLCSCFLTQALPHPQPRTEQAPGNIPIPASIPGACATSH